MTDIYLHSDNTFTCEQCDGNGEIEVYWSNTSPDDPDMYKCTDCYGEGIIDEDNMLYDYYADTFLTELGYKL